MASFITFDPGLDKNVSRFEIHDFGIGSLEADGLVSKRYPGHMRALLRHQVVSATHAIVALSETTVPWSLVELLWAARDKEVIFDSVKVNQPQRSATMLSVKITAFNNYVMQDKIITLEFKSSRVWNT
jgi:hypothetical protein